MTAPLTRNYNLGRLGNAGDQVRIEADGAECAAIANLAEAQEVSRFLALVTLEKAGPTRYRLTYRLEADVVQPCVVTLEPVPATITRDFIRELHFIGVGSQRAEVTDLDLSSVEDEEPEEIESLHFDLAGPALEEFLLGLAPYPRAAGVEFTPSPEAQEAKVSPFAALKSLKSRT